MTDRREYKVEVEATGTQAAKPEWEKRLYAIAERLDARLGMRFWLLAGLIVASLAVGTPHVLVHYQCYGRCGPDATETNCEYIGLRGWRKSDSERGRCLRLRLL